MTPPVHVGAIAGVYRPAAGETVEARYDSDGTVVAIGPLSTGPRDRRAHLGVIRADRPPEDDGPRVLNLQALYDNPEMLAPVVATIPRLCWPRRLTILAAESKGGKSTLVGHAVATYSRQGPFLGEPTTGGRVLWVTEEPLDDVVRRFRDSAAAPPFIDVAELGTLGTSPAARIGALAALADDGDSPYDVIIVDTMTKLLQGIESMNDAAQLSPHLGALRDIAGRTGVAILGLHHTNKGNGTFAGSHAFAAYSDTLLTMTKKERDDGRRFLKVQSRLPGLDDFVVRFDHATHTYEIAEAREQSATIRIRDYVALNPDCSARQITAAIGGRADVARHEIAACITHGIIVNAGTVRRPAYRVPVHAAGRAPDAPRDALTPLWRSTAEHPDAPGTHTGRTPDARRDAPAQVSASRSHTPSVGADAQSPDEPDF